MADDEQFSLCWNNFNSNLSAGFHESLLRGDLVDVTLAAEGQLVKAHRLILSVCSPYFRKMFTQVPVNQHAFIFLKDVSHSALKDLIQFMYCGEVNVKQDALPAFISTAEALQIKGLTESGDSVPANQSPIKEEISTPVSATTSLPAPTNANQRSKVQRNRIQSFKIDSEESGDDKVQIQASSSHHVASVQQAQQAVATTQKRTLQQRNVTSQASKRTKMSVSASSEGMDTSDTTTTQVQTVQIVKQIPAQAIEPEYIELPIESINPKHEPDYTDEPTEIETVDAETEQEQKLSEHDQGEADDDGNYVEDEAYGEIAITKYDESYLTEGEDNVKPGVSGFVDSYTSDGGTGTEQSTQASGRSDDCGAGPECVQRTAVNGKHLFLSSRKGGLQLVHDNYIYRSNLRRQGRNRDVIYWECVYNRGQKCRGRLKTIGNVIFVSNGKVEHNHPNDRKRIVNATLCDDGKEYLSVVEADRSAYSTCTDESDTTSQDKLLFIRSPWGRKLLVYDGYTYCTNKRVQATNTTYWRCTMAHRRNVQTLCEARCTVRDGRIVKMCETHNHAREKLRLHGKVFDTEYSICDP
uniref:BTB domain-containing protein n=1 Tax=Anopheles farauti TaxID=69004 RepID=A0A182QVF5_9DIPT